MRASRTSRRVAGSSAVAVGPGGDEELLGEERVAAGPRVDRFQERGVQVVAGDRPELLLRLATVERLELQALDPACPPELAEEGQQRVAAMQLVGAVGEDQHHPGLPQVPHQESEQVARRPVRTSAGPRRRTGPGAGRQAFEHAEEQFEQATLGRQDVHARSGPVGGRRCLRRRTQVRDEPAPAPSVPGRGSSPAPRESLAWARPRRASTTGA